MFESGVSDGCAADIVDCDGLGVEYACLAKRNELAVVEVVAGEKLTASWPMCETFNYNIQHCIKTTLLRLILTVSKWNFSRPPPVVPGRTTSSVSPKAASERNKDTRGVKRLPVARRIAWTRLSNILRSVVNLSPQ